MENELELTLHSLERNGCAYRRTNRGEMVVKATPEAVNYLKGMMDGSILDSPAGFWGRFGKVHRSGEVVE